MQNEPQQNMSGKKRYYAGLSLSSVSLVVFILAFVPNFIVGAMSDRQQTLVLVASVVALFVGIITAKRAQKQNPDIAASRSAKGIVAGLSIMGGIIALFVLGVGSFFVYMLVRLQQ